ncbi:triple tyrosine motif-containing protein, partial [Clostridium sp.]|uniref:triple tyrosine motif-containing protein n=1 Tax=Clostridium sp. TaxID=1506 RepID=UPI003463FAF7
MSQKFKHISTLTLIFILFSVPILNKDVISNASTSNYTSNRSKIEYSVNGFTKAKLNSVEFSKPSPLTKGDTLTVKATSSSSNPLYRFWVLEDGAWKLLKDYTKENTFTWTPSKAGSYRVFVDVKDANSPFQYDDAKEVQ